MYMVFRYTIVDHSYESYALVWPAQGSFGEYVRTEMCERERERSKSLESNDSSDGLPRRQDVTTTTANVDDKFAIDVF